MAILEETNDLPMHSEHPSRLPASAVAILGRLQPQTPMTGKQLREATGLPRRTLFTALQRLREAGLVLERRSLQDSRQTYFWLVE